jgi:hypothetical protein
VFLIVVEQFRGKKILSNTFIKYAVGKVNDYYKIWLQLKVLFLLHKNISFNEVGDSWKLYLMT